jgi:hypothetical protein
MHEMVKRNLHQPFEFSVLEEAEGLQGWWVKLALFQPGRFKGRVLYLDLDSVVVGVLDELAESKGIIYMPDWGWADPLLNSSVMVWDAGEHAEAYLRYTPWVAKRLEGDDEWLTLLGGWEHLPARLCRSYRYHAREAPPEACAVVTFHGRPKPHEVTDGWVPTFWRT